tara:strand:- start:37 stop:246 length:210 start_codon:yes stop_codon:yes gene_type:complete
MTSPLESPAPSTRTPYRTVTVRLNRKRGRFLEERIQVMQEAARRNGSRINVERILQQLVDRWMLERGEL